MTEQEKYLKYDKAKARVKQIKGFYNHLKIYILVNGLIIIARAVVLNYVEVPQEQGFRDWLNWNTFISPILWGIGLFFHWLYVFHLKNSFLKNWEDRKIKEIIEKEEREANRNWE